MMRLLQRISSLIRNPFGMMICAFLLSNPQAFGETIFDNLRTPQTAFAVNSVGWQAQSFRTGDEPMELDKVGFILHPHVGDGLFQVRLFTNILDIFGDFDSLDRPGIPLETLTGPGNPQTGTFYYSSLVNSILQPDTLYWIVFSSSTNKDYAITLEFMTNGTEIGSSVGHRISADAGASWGIVPIPGLLYNINISVTGIPIVPEPASISLLLIMGLSLTRRSRRCCR